MEYNCFGKIVWVSMLYTKADYTATNACYEKNRLCSSGKTVYYRKDKMTNHGRADALCEKGVPWTLSTV